MSDFTVRSDAVDVEEIMRQIRARIRDKRGVDYTEEQIQELANARLEKFLDPRGVRSDLLEQYRRQRAGGTPPSRAYAFEDTTLFESDKAIVRVLRTLLKPILKLFFNYNVLNHVLHTQAAINHARDEQDLLAFEVMHNLVVEMTRTSIEVKNLRMRLESVQSRLEFNERRARALEAVVQYRPDAVAAARSDAPPAPGTEPQGGVDPITGGESLRTRRRRRRRGRRSGGTGAATEDAAANGEPADATDEGLDDRPDERDGAHARRDDRIAPDATGAPNAPGTPGAPAPDASRAPVPAASRAPAPDASRAAVPQAIGAAAPAAPFAPSPGPEGEAARPRTDDPSGDPSTT